MDDINMDLKKIECEGVDWLHLARYKDTRRAVVNTVMNLLFPQNAVEFLD